MQRGVGAPCSRLNCKTKVIWDTSLLGISGHSRAELLATSPTEPCLLLSTLRLIWLLFLGFWSLCWLLGPVPNQQVCVGLVHTAFVCQPFPSEAGLAGDASFPLHAPRT